MASNRQWRSHSVAVNPHVSLTLGELVDGWQAHVRRFIAELDTADTDRTTWGAHDFVGALIIRDALDRGLARLRDEDLEDAISHVADADRLLEAQSEPDHSGLLKAFVSPEATGGSWWWLRIPIRGPVRSDLESL